MDKNMFNSDIEKCLNLMDCIVSPSKQAASLEENFIANKNVVLEQLATNDYSVLQSLLNDRKRASFVINSLDLEISEILLDLLYGYLNLKLSEETRNPPYEEILTPNQKLNFGRAFKLIFSFGLHPALEKEIVLWDAERLKLGLLPWKLRDINASERYEQLNYFVSRLVELSRHYTEYVINKNNLPVDLIGAFLTLAFSPNCQLRGYDIDRKLFFEQLQKLCDVNIHGDSVYTSLFLVKDIQLTRPQTWFKSKINHFLLNCLLRKGGLFSLLKLNDLSSFDHDKAEWKKAEICSKLVIECSKMTSSPECFIKFLGPQILDIYFSPKFSKSSKLIFYCLTSVVHALVAHDSHYLVILDKLFYPLLFYLKDSDFKKRNPTPKGTDLVKCIELMYKVYIDLCGKPNEEMLKYIFRYLNLFFSILRDCKTTYSATRCRDLIVLYLLNSEKSEEIIFNVASEQMKNEILLNQFYSETDGTIQIKDKLQKLPDKFDRVNDAFLHILSVIPKNSRLLSNMFLFLIGKLDDIINNENTFSEDTPINQLHTSEPLMDIEKRIAHIEEINNKKIYVMKALERLCHMSPSVLLENVSNLIRFITLTLKRAAGLLEDAHDDNIIECQIINVNMTTDMLTFLLETNSDEVFKLKQENMDELFGLLPILSKIEEIYDPSEAAEKLLKLRITISTRGKIMGDKLYQNYDVSIPCETDKELQYLVDPFFDNLENLSKNKTHNGIVTLSTDDETGSVGSFQQILKDLSDPLVPVKGHALIVLKRLINGRDEYILKEYNFILKTIRKLLEHEDSYIYGAAVNCLQALARIKGETIPKIIEDYGNTNQLSIKVRLKLGESVQKIVSDLFEMLPLYKNKLLPLLVNMLSEDVDVIKVSSLSILADCCRILKFSIGIYMSDILMAVECLLKNNKSSLVKRASAMFIEFYLRGLTIEMIAVSYLEIHFDILINCSQQDHSRELKSLYSIIKYGLSVEVDESTLYHLSAAKENLDDLMKLFFQSSEKLEKTIYVADVPEEPFKNLFL